jgi:hypothetical protein
VYINLFSDECSLTTIQCWRAKNAKENTKMTTGIVSLLVGIVAFILGAVCIYRLGNINGTSIKGDAILAVLLMGAAMILGILAGGNTAKDSYKEDLSKDVNMQQVPKHGMKSFYAIIQLSYKDGKLDSISLIKNTTTTSPTANQ